MARDKIMTALLDEAAGGVNAIVGLDTELSPHLRNHSAELSGHDNRAQDAVTPSYPGHSGPSLSWTAHRDADHAGSSASSSPEAHLLIFILK